MSEIDSSLKQHSLALTEMIKQRISQDKNISFSEFMQMALYQPGMGYYSSGLHKFGEQGDFVTSPELGVLFAQCMAQQFKQVLSELESPVILELGAGTGQFCLDCLLELEKLDCLPHKYYILEVSADLKSRQQKKIKQLPKPIQKIVEWINQPPSQEYNGVIFANEVVDALPVEVFKLINDEFKQMRVGYDTDFTKEWCNFSSQLETTLINKKLDLASGYESEFIPFLSQWLQSISSCLLQGVIIFVDYGYERDSYYHPQREQGTLVCHLKHQANFDYFNNIGIQDITSFVDFTALAEAADDCGLVVDGYTSQAHFLLSLDIHNKLGNAEDEFEAYYKKSTEMKKLTMPNEMGEKFKVMALSRKFDEELLGFTLANQLHLL
ncbi:MAG: class I SAM-dependent methyltransferase [Marinicellaceae bacterium]